ncbi:hypothetical protein, partial [Pontibacter burrus]|uniref:hypothetical protein n=1 Tax=Pontibacter burrus TaxID=2704466 RepID=UPI001952BB81
GKYFAPIKTNSKTQTVFDSTQTQNKHLKASQILKANSLRTLLLQAFISFRKLQVVLASFL